MNPPSVLDSIALDTFTDGIETETYRRIPAVIRGARTSFFAIEGLEQQTAFNEFVEMRLYGSERASLEWMKKAPPGFVIRISHREVEERSFGTFPRLLAALSSEWGGLERYDDPATMELHVARPGDPPETPFLSAWLDRLPWRYSLRWEWWKHGSFLRVFIYPPGNYWLGQGFPAEDPRQAEQDAVAWARGAVAEKRARLAESSRSAG